MRILITGSNGQLGAELQTVLNGTGEIIAIAREDLDFTNDTAIREVITTIQPNLVINAAAYTAVDKAESEVDVAMAVNGKAVEILAQECDKLGAGLIHVSTDYVFDGNNNRPYLETDVTNPLSVYGQSKLAGELAIQANCHNYIILRTAWVYGIGGKGNFVKTMLRLGGDRDEIRVVADQIGSPTWTGDLALAIKNLIPHLSREKSGIYHFTNSGVASWYDFAVAIFAEAKLLGIPLKVKQVIPITTPEYPTPAKRPAFSVLSCKKITEITGNYPPHWRESLRLMLQQLHH